MMDKEFRKLKEKRQGWVKANRENGFDEGINRLLTELYPDNAHFIYELLQNAEDPKATEVTFILSKDKIEFEHNGVKFFNLKDVDSITSIGNSTKRDDITAIGKFGVGFKAVFAYTHTPEIHSGDFHFRIHDLVIPETDGVNRQSSNPKQTRFIFPFNNPKKPPEIAVKEIETGLRSLGDNTLLFLNHIRKIVFILPDGTTGIMQRFNRDFGHIEISYINPESKKAISHWLQFHKSVEVEDQVIEDGKTKICNKTCTIAIAYQLEQETGKHKEQSQWKIVPVQYGGQVSIYFPAEKETSKLHFHLHAPFASTVARDSVRDCYANEQLRDYLAELTAESLIVIRDQGMLSMSFLAILPNQKDNLSKFYEPIRQKVVEAFKSESLTPTRGGNHAKSSSLYRGPARIAAIISDEDLSFLTQNDIPLWAANPPQQNQREGNFLDSLAMDRWDYEQLSAIFQSVEKDKVEAWLTEKDDGWMMSFYELLNEAKDHYDRNERRMFYYQNLTWPGLTFPLVRVESQQGVKHAIACNAYFSSEDNILPPDNIDIVKRSIYIKDDKNNGGF